jgi:hypothetical protein
MVKRYGAIVLRCSRRDSAAPSGSNRLHPSEAKAGSLPAALEWLELPGLASIGLPVLSIRRPAYRDHRTWIDPKGSRMNRQLKHVRNAIAALFHLSLLGAQLGVGERTPKEKSCRSLRWGAPTLFLGPDPGCRSCICVAPAGATDSQPGLATRRLQSTSLIPLVGWSEIVLAVAVLVKLVPGLLLVLDTWVAPDTASLTMIRRRIGSIAVANLDR